MRHAAIWGTYSTSFAQHDEKRLTGGLDHVESQSFKDLLMPIFPAPAAFVGCVQHSRPGTLVNDHGIE
jgi:hypothetical protein